MNTELSENSVVQLNQDTAMVNGNDHSLNGVVIPNGIATSDGKSKNSSSSSNTHHHKSASKDKHRDRDRERDRDRDHKKSSGHHSSSSSANKDKSSSSSSNKDKDRHSTSSSHHKSANRDKDKDKEHRSGGHSGGEKSKYSSNSSSSKDKDRNRDTDKDRNGKPSSSSTSSSTKDKIRSNDKDKDKSRSDQDKVRSSDKNKSTTSSSSSKDHKSSSNHKTSSSNKDKDRHHTSSSTSSSKPKDKHSSTHHSSSSSKSKDKDKDRHSSSHKSSDKDRSKDKHRDRSEHTNNKDKDKYSKDGNDESKTKRRRNQIQDDSSDEIDSNKPEHSDGNAQQPAINIYNSAESNNNNNINDELQHNNILHHEDDNDDEEIDENTLPSTPDLKLDMKDCKIMIKDEKGYLINNSLNSSCDYSLSQFKDDEKPFYIKAEATDEESQDCVFINSTNDNSSIKREVEDEEDDDDDVPIAKRKKLKVESDDEDDVPLIARKKPKESDKSKKAKKKKRDDSEDDEDYEEYDEKPKKKKAKKEKKAEKKLKQEPVKTETVTPPKAGGRKKKEEPEVEVWKWWEEDKRDDNVKWLFLEHKGPVFAPPYIPLPASVTFEYDGQVMKLSPDTEEIACFYAKMLEHDYTSKKIFNDNFFKDWRKAMTSKEREKITKLERCNFRKMHAHFQSISEQNKNRTKEEKAKLKAENEALITEYGYCTIDGHKEKIGNFKIEPPGLFRGRGEHPKMGMIKKRLSPEDVLINCSRDSKIPVPPSGHKWREVRHDNTVTWLASWTENVQGQVKYIMLNPSSKLKGEKDFQKYETARRLHQHIDKIRNTYRDEWKSKEMRIRQRAVALYFIDKLALRAGNEKDEDQADTVGCCSLRVEHIQLHKKLDGKENVVVFDFLGKDSIRYYNEVEVEKRVFKNLELFKDNKKDGDDLFDRLNTVVMNEHLRELMDGLTAKVFRTYNASWTLQTQLLEMTDPDATLPEKILAYNRANRAVAILCNHQRSIPKSHEKSMENLKDKIVKKKEQVEDAQAEVEEATKAARRGSVKEKVIADKKKKMLARLKDQLKKLELQETDRDENKTIALGTSKLNYLDPRISVAWCKKHEVPLDKIYNKTQRDKFLWAISMATPDFHF